MRLLTVALVILMSSPLWSQSPDLPGALRVQIGTNYLVDEPADMGLGLWVPKLLMPIISTISGWESQDGASPRDSESVPISCLLMMT